MLSNKQKMDLLMESLEAVESDSENINEARGPLQNKMTPVYFDDSLSNDPNVAFAIEAFISSIRHLLYIGDVGAAGGGSAKEKFILDKFKRYGIDLKKLKSQLYSIKTGDFNYPPKEEKPDRGPFGV
jgi:hypothetical protein